MKRKAEITTKILKLEAEREEITNRFMKRIKVKYDYSRYTHLCHQIETLEWVLSKTEDNG